jgi:hypothetical protein
LDPETLSPEQWRVRAQAVGGGTAPRRLGDGVTVVTRSWSDGPIDRDDPVDRAVCATLEAVLPLHDAAQFGFR